MENQRRRFGSTSDPNLNGHLHYPNDIHRSLNEDVTDRLGNITLTTIIILLPLSPLCLLFLVRRRGYIVSCDVLLTVQIKSR